MKSPEKLREHFSSGRTAYCLIEEDVFEAERRTIGLDLVIRDRQPIGHRDFLLLAGGGPPGAASSGDGKDP